MDLERSVNMETVKMLEDPKNELTRDSTVSVEHLTAQADFSRTVWWASNRNSQIKSHYSIDYLFTCKVKKYFYFDLRRLSNQRR